MTKTELEKELADWKQTAESLQDELDALNEAYGELENENYELANTNIRGIKDIDNFIFRMKIDGYWTVEFENFVNRYLIYYND